MKKRALCFTKFDRDRLEELLSSGETDRQRDREDLKELREELAKGNLVASKDVPPDVITMHSKVRVRDLDQDEETIFTLVFPAEADVEHGLLSVLSPIGTALLGYAAGETITWQVPAGTRRFRIEEVLYQPEAAGDYHL